MVVSGYNGAGLVNSYLGGDESVGELESPEFLIERTYMSFLIGGGKDLDATAMNLVVDGRTVRRATGPNSRPGGTEALHPEGWDLRDLQGKRARIRIIDRATGGWGHINVDQIVLTDRKPPMIVKAPHRTIRIDHRFLLIPIKRGAPRRHLTLEIEGLKTSNDVALADGQADWWASIDLSQYKGKPVKLGFDELMSDSKGLDNIRTADSLPNLYKETYRPRYHFSARSGWLNDPNGLAFYRGEYHMFFQHDPVGGGTDNKLWGHAVSKDLVHWQELPDALYPDNLGSMWSGSAVVDWNNSSGFGTPGNPPLVLVYTAAGDPSTQCIAYTTDGRNFTKYRGNPVIKQITPYNRDPKVIWHDPTKRWVMTLYVEHDGKHFIEFHSSPDLKHWTYLSKTEGFFECPDFFSLPVNNTAERKWILTAADSGYMVGTFDGHTFTPETPKIRGHFGTGYYAPQTFSDIPEKDGRRIQIGWMLTNPPDMPFTQSMSVPMTLELVRSDGTYRVVRRPVAELTRLESPKTIDSIDLSPGSPNPLESFRGEAAHLRLTLGMSKDADLQLSVRGISVRLTNSSLEVEGQRLNWKGSEVTIDAYIDRVGMELFVDGDYLPLPVTPDTGGYSISVRRGYAKLKGSFGVMKSIWVDR